MEVIFEYYLQFYAVLGLVVDADLRVFGGNLLYFPNGCPYRADSDVECRV